MKIVYSHFPVTVQVENKKVLIKNFQGEKAARTITIMGDTKITKCGAVTPRFKVKKNEYNEWEQKFLPSYDRGMLIITTNQGVMSHHEAANKGIGGFLIGYVY